MSKSDSSAGKLHQPEVLPAQRSRVDLGQIFGDPSMSETAVNDPVLKFISSSWRQVVGTVLAAVAIFYGVNIFRDNYNASLAAAGDAFGRVQREFDVLGNQQREVKRIAATAATATDKEKQKKDLEEAQTRVATTRKTLESALAALADAREPYPTLAGIYRGLLLEQGGDFAAVKATFSGSEWESVKSDENGPRLFAELKAISFARTALDHGDKALGLSILEALAQRGMYVHTAAALTIASIATTNEERDSAVKILEGVLAAHPEQNDLISPELTRLQG